MRPVSQPLEQISLGKMPSSSRWPATGTISLRANSRAVSISCCCSSEKSKLGIAEVYGYPPRPTNVSEWVPMPAQYLDEFIRELRRDGEETLRATHAEPVLIVTKAAGELGSD